MSLQASERCPRCGGGFHCGISDTAPCACSTLNLDAATLAVLQEFRVPADVVGQYAPGAQVPVSVFAAEVPLMVCPVVGVTGTVAKLKASAVLIPE